MICLNPSHRTNSSATWFWNSCWFKLRGLVTSNTHLLWDWPNLSSNSMPTEEQRLSWFCQVPCLVKLIAKIHTIFALHMYMFWTTLHIRILWGIGGPVVVVTLAINRQVLHLPVHCTGLKITEPTRYWFGIELVVLNYIAWHIKFNNGVAFWDGKDMSTTEHLGHHHLKKRQVYLRRTFPNNP